ncbi:BatA domain-containing protein [Pontibacter sp. G13]|uniref:BatA domain-containing protein n=1 Tax=Pontibacter sp. G13 TaxID=3074898 RepID=UPI00288B3C10|nr:BatA domain-containing protein [Pontibacter sp. G13]WNJ18843.1 BatA domain-containing protein [Pontibacter sp. G13]
MTFLHPAALWGLLALAVPIIVHFFNLQRPKRVLFSNVAFVREVKKSVVRRVQFKQWLLLLARLLVIGMLVLAFAGPVIVNSETGAVQRGNRSVALVVDNSFSMTAGNERGAYFQQALSLGRNLIQAYSNQDEFLIMPASDLKLSYNFGDQEEALEQLKGLSLKQHTRGQSDILKFKEDLFNRATYQAFDLYYLSDFQKSTVMADTLDIVTVDSTLQISYIPLATRHQSNMYVSDHRFLSRILEKDKPINMSMTLVNDGQSDVDDLSVRVLVEGRVAAISTTDLEAGEVEELEVSFTPTTSGWVSGYIEIDDTPVDFDNRRYFSFYIPEKEKVLIIEDQPSRNVHLLYQQVFNQFEPTFLDAKRVSTVQLNEFKSIVWVGISDLSTGMAARLTDFLGQGGSLLIFPGENMQLNQVNTLLKDLRIGTYEPMVKLPDGQAAKQVDLYHPVFEGIFVKDQKRQSFDAPMIYQRYGFKLSNRSISNKVMSLEDQSPVLLDIQLEQGQVFLFTTFPGDQWTDLHVKTIFTPLLFKITQIMNQTQQENTSQTIGSFQPHAVPAKSGELIQLTKEDGTTFTPEQYPKSGATILDFEQMELEPGNYRIEQDGQLLEKISFNISDEESKLACFYEADLRNKLDSDGLGIIQITPPSVESLTDKIQTDREGIPLWKYFIAAALLFLAVEIIMLVFRTS